MVKSILKRIIVGVGIALCLMAIKGGLISNVSALTTIGITSPNNFTLIANDNSNVPINTISQFTYNATYFYGFKSSGSVARQGAYWTYNGNRFTNGTYDISFITYLYQANINQANISVPQAWITNGGKTYSCHVSNNTASFNGYINPFTCDNVNIDNSSNVIIHVGAFSTVSGSNYGISNITLTLNNDTVIAESSQATAQSTQEINDSLNDSSTDDPGSDLSDMNSKIASNNSITQLLTLPISLYQNILNAVNGSCSTFSLGTLYNHSITLPCINLENLLGSTLFGIIDILISGLFILSFRKKMVDIFNHMTSLNDRGNEVE